jgi:hypothetical protein
VRGARGSRWTEFADGRAVDALKALTPDVVDQVLFELLDAIDNERLPLAWRRRDGSYVSLAELGLGELAGWVMMGKGGWIDRYSAQRYFDPLADLP